ncbi:MAG: hypothetical protein ABI904_05385 [Chloroflexota bacterium]
MKNQIVIVLLATRSIPLRDGLVALLTAIPQIDKVEIAGSFEAALLRVKAGKPQIILVELILLGNTPEAALEQIHILSPGTQRVILMEDLQEIKSAEALLTRGLPPSAIVDTVSKLLSNTEGDDQIAGNKQ